MGTKDGVPAADTDRAWTADVVESGHILALQASTYERAKLERLARAAGNSQGREKPMHSHDVLRTVAKVHRLPPRGGWAASAARASS
jgi:hypothetical protein